MPFADSAIRKNALYRCEVKRGYIGAKGCSPIRMKAGNSGVSQRMLDDQVEQIRSHCRCVCIGQSHVLHLLYVLERGGQNLGRKSTCSE